MSATLILSRKNEWANRLRSYKVFADGELIGTIDNGKTETFSVSVLSQTIYCKIDWAYSNKYNISIADGDTLRLRVGSGMKKKWLFYVVIFLYFFAVGFWRSYLKARGIDDSWTTWAFIVPGILIYIYLFTIGRHKYLVLEKDEAAVATS